MCVHPAKWPNDARHVMLFAGTEKWSRASELQPRPHCGTREIEVDVTGEFRFEYLAAGSLQWRFQIERFTFCGYTPA